MKPIPAYTFIEPWNPLSCRCKLAVNSVVYEVLRWTAPVRIVRYTARKDGAIVAERAKFTTLLRDLGGLSASAKPTPPLTTEQHSRSLEPWMR